jgi:hypothetical protein
MQKALNLLQIEGAFLNIVKDMYDKTITKIMLNREKLKSFPQNKAKVSTLSLSFNIVLEILARAITQEKK